MARMNVPRNDDIETMMDEVLENRRLRLDVLAMDDMVPRRCKRRPRPQTAIIARAAAGKQLAREWVDAVEAGHRRFARQRPCAVPNADDTP